MSEELRKSFTMLNLNKKRNQISNELMIICELIKNMEQYLGISNEIIKVKDYNETRDAMLNENEMLTFFYEDIYNIQRELITLMQLFTLNRNNK